MPFQQPVSARMTRDLQVAPSTASVRDVLRGLDERRVSALPLVDAAGAMVGVVSRSDLLRVGRFRGRRVLELPDLPAAELVTRTPVVCSPETSMQEAARAMVKHRVHRIFVVEDQRPVGVISTVEITAAVRDARSDGRIETIMSAPVLTIEAVAPMGAAVAELERAHVTALIVVDERWPIGMLTQADALAARDLPPETPVDDVMDAAVICMRTLTCLHHAAAQAARLDVRRVIVCKGGDAVGIVSGLDFARIVAT